MFFVKTDQPTKTHVTTIVDRLVVANLFACFALDTVNDGNRERETVVGVGCDRNQTKNIAIAHVDATQPTQTIEVFRVVSTGKADCRK